LKRKKQHIAIKLAKGKAIFEQLHSFIMTANLWILGRNGKICWGPSASELMMDLDILLDA